MNDQMFFAVHSRGQSGAYAYADGNFAAVAAGRDYGNLCKVKYADFASILADCLGKDTRQGDCSFAAIRYSVQPSHILAEAACGGGGGCVVLAQDGIKVLGGGGFSQQTFAVQGPCAFIAAGVPVSGRGDLGELLSALTAAKDELQFRRLAARNFAAFSLSCLGFADYRAMRSAFLAARPAPSPPV